jgi:enamine deaminase RidA (YjgF/YER057c/UK114 family)
VTLLIKSESLKARCFDVIPMLYVQSAIDDRLNALGLTWPDPPPAAGHYRPVVIRHGVGVVSGQFPWTQGRLEVRGRAGAEVGLIDARNAAATAALNCIAHIRAATGFTNFGGLLRLEGYIAAAPDFQQLPQVLDGASERLLAVLGPTLGEHARSVIPVAQLPFDATVELVLAFAVDVGRPRREPRRMRRLSGSDRRAPFSRRSRSPVG